jgi:hypothetical protein
MGNLTKKLPRMKIRVLSVVVIMILSASFQGCSKDQKDLNLFTITGNSNPDINGEYHPEAGDYYIPYLACQGEGDLYRSSFGIDLTDGSYIDVMIHNSTNSPGIPAGTFNPALICEQGMTGRFYPFADGGVSVSKLFESGSMTIKTEDDIFEIDIDVTFPSSAGGGRLKGNFKGTLERNDQINK